MNESLVYKPTAFSEVFNATAEEASQHLELSMSGGLFARIRFEGRVRAYLLGGYRDTFKEVQQFLLPDRTGDTSVDIEALISAFEELYPKIVFNNVALTYLTKGADFSVDVMTKEDEKNQLLGEMGGDDLRCETFKKKFGHYAFNAYEVQERRFREYSCRELQNIGSVVAGLNIKTRPTLEEYFERHTGKATPSHLVGIREFGKSRALQVVAALRTLLLEIEDDLNLDKSIFDYSHQEILRKL